MKIVKWFVNKKLKTTEYAEFLGNQSIKIYPNVYLYNQNDTI